MTGTGRNGDHGEPLSGHASSVKGGARHMARSRRRFGIIEILAFLIGLGIFLYPLVAAYLNYAGTTEAVDTYEDIVNRLTPEQRQKMWRDAKQYDEDLGKPTLRDPFKYKEVKEPLGRYSKILNVDGKGMMAYVDIPKINVKLPIRHGTTDEVLRDSVGHIATTHVPTDNKTIHAVVTGHTGEVGHILFDNLTQLKKGDVFQIRVLKKRMSYQVDQIKVILPTDVDALQPVEGSNYVTLLTCTPYGINSHRLIIRGRYIGDDVPPTKPKGAPVYMLWVLLALMALCLLAWYYLSIRRKKCRHRIASLDRFEPNDGEAEPFGFGSGGDDGGVSETGGGGAYGTDAAGGNLAVMGTPSGVSGQWGAVSPDRDSSFEGPPGIVRAGTDAFFGEEGGRTGRSTDRRTPGQAWMDRSHATGEEGEYDG